ncbi:MAG: putative PEP-binding protein, partial [Synechococcales bacterium]|nr:putative PEP-binding protein [Synechococcales bacterium]
LPPQAIIVSTHLSPPQVLQIGGAIALILEMGGLTSHTAILAREMGLQVIVGVPHATQVIQTGDRLSLRGGNIFRLVSISESMAGMAEPTGSDAQPSQLAQQRPHQNGQRGTQLWVNLNRPDRAEQVAATDIEGVGLVRSELLLLAETLSEQELPVGAADLALRQRWWKCLTPILQAFAPRPVFYRLLDWNLKTGVLGLHGTQQYLQNPAWFHWELARLLELQQRGYTNVRLLLPFVRTVEEFQVCRSWIEQVGLFQQPGFELWIMAEVPAIVFTLADFIAAGVQGIVIGTGDLSALILGQDRESAATLPLSQPAVQAAMGQLIQTAQRHQLPCHLCLHGLQPDQAVIDRAIQLGVTGFSVEPDAISAMLTAIARAEQKHHPPMPQGTWNPAPNTNFGV